jgi:GDP-L-fucose synthase
MKNSNILITGNRGFLGRHLSSELKKLNCNLYFSNTKIANLMDYKNLKVYDDVKFDFIFHLAAHTKAGDYCLYHKGEQFEINQTINTNILKYWRESQPQAKMIAMGTSCSYSPNLDLSEENYLKGEPDDGLYTYAMTKRMLLIGLKSLSEQYGLKFMYYVPSTLYGEEFDIEDSHFIFDLIKKIHSGKKYGTEVVLWGDGYQKRELIYVKDAIDIILKTINNNNNKIINLGTGVEYSIREYAEKICDVIHYDKNKIIYDESKYVGVKSKKLSTKNLDSLLANYEYSKIENVLQNVIKYYINKENEKVGYNK